MQHERTNKQTNKQTNAPSIISSVARAIRSCPELKKPISILFLFCVRLLFRYLIRKKKRQVSARQVSKARQAMCIIVVGIIVCLLLFHKKARNTNKISSPRRNNNNNNNNNKPKSDMVFTMMRVCVFDLVLSFTCSFVVVVVLSCVAFGGDDYKF